MTKAKTVLFGKAALVALLVTSMAGCASFAPLTTTGAVETLQTDESVAQAADVSNVYPVKSGDGAKIFIRVGGDPAINGLWTYYSVYDEELRGPRSWLLGDFNEVKIVRDTQTETALQISKTRVLENGDYATDTSYLIIAAPKPGDTTLTVTPAKR